MGFIGIASGFNLIFNSEKCMKKHFLLFLLMVFLTILYSGSAFACGSCHSGTEEGVQLTDGDAIAGDSLEVANPFSEVNNVEVFMVKVNISGSSINEDRRRIQGFETVLLNLNRQTHPLLDACVGFIKHSAVAMEYG